MTVAVDDTIAAIASPPGAARRAVIRVSGSDTSEVVGQVFTRSDHPDWTLAERPMRVAGRVKLEGLPSGLPCDLLFWPTSSYTGQQAIELHCVGSEPLVNELLAQLLTSGARPANRGEFTLRAFLAGKLDLPQAEAVLSVIDASDVDELQVALTQLDGGLSGPLRELHERLLIDLADLEAGLDFADEDLDFVSRAEFIQRLLAAITEVERLLGQSDARGRVHAADVVVLTGPPNAGKSTLFNRLTKRDAAIVSEQAGTTRDQIEAAWQCGDRSLRLIDTAGIDEGGDPIVVAAEQRRRVAVSNASLVLYCVPVGGELDHEELARLRSNRPVLTVRTKADALVPTNEELAVSAKTGTGLKELVAIVGDALSSDASERAVLLASTAARCRNALEAAGNHLREAHLLLEAAAGDELVAGELRTALDSMAAVLGEVYTDDILDRVFSRFCIGK